MEYPTNKTSEMVQNRGATFPNHQEYKINKENNKIMRWVGTLYFSNTD